MILQQNILGLIVGLIVFHHYFTCITSIVIYDKDLLTIDSIISRETDRESTSKQYLQSYIFNIDQYA